MPIPRFTAATCLLVATASLSAQDWSLRTFTTQPAGATFTRMAFDLARARCVAFGGWNAPTGTIVFADTWEYDGVTWLLRTPATIPDERESHVMAYDQNRGRTVMFGGWDFNFVYLSQTYEWDGTDWTNVNPPVSPPARLLAGMVYDLGRARIVLFGGNLGAQLLADTWEYDGTTWTQRTTANAPSARNSHAMAYDAARSRVVLFGGWNGTNLLGDTWEYDGTDWTPITTDGAPPARVDAGMVFDTQGARCVLFGGADALVERDDTWEYDARGWRQRTTGSTPAAVSSMGMAYDMVRGVSVVVGGFDGFSAPTATWELGGSGGTFAVYGTGCLGSNNLAPRLRPMTVPDLGTTAQLDITDLPGSSGFVYLGGGLSDATLGSLPLPLDLASIGLTGCRAYMSNDVGVVLAHTNGTASWSLPVPNHTALVGFRMFLQALSLDPVVARPFPGAMSGGAEFLVR